MREPAYAPPRSGVVRGACPHDCPDTCAWEVTVEDGRAVKLAGVKEHPYTRGGLCAKVSHYLERAASPERLLVPLRRSGPKGVGRFEQVGWDEALDLVAERLRAIVAEHGGEAVLPYSFTGTQGLVQGASMAERFFHRLGAIELERDICGQAAAAGAAATIGSGPAMVPQDLPHSRLIVLWGTNTIVTNLHLWPLVQEARAAGARVVVIDPLRTRTAQAADRHIAPMPGSDAALALGLMHVIVREGLHDADYLERYTTGFDELRERLAEYPPARVAADHGPGRGRDRAARAGLRDDAPGRDPRADRDGAPRARRRGVPRDRLPAGARRRVARARRRAAAHDRLRGLGAAEPGRASSARTCAPPRRAASTWCASARR